jgi:hypothetical protein
MRGRIQNGRNKRRWLGWGKWVLWKGRKEFDGIMEFKNIVVARDSFNKRGTREESRRLCSGKCCLVYSLAGMHWKGGGWAGNDL